MSGPIYGGNDPKKGLADDGPGQKGVYATYPAATPKYNADNHLFSRDETQARMYIEIPDPGLYNAYLSAIPPDAVPYAEAMTRTLGASGGKGYVSFFLVSANEPLREKVQVSEVLSDTHIAYFFGQSAPVWSYQMGLINSQQDEWYDAWHIVYENIIRGTRLAETKTAVTLAYDTRRVIGSVMQTQTALNAANELAVMGSFSILVKEVQVAVKVTDSLALAAVSSQAAQDDAEKLSAFDEQNKQTATLEMPVLAIQRQRALDGTSMDEERMGIRPGHNPLEVELKTGITPTNAATEQQFQLVANKPLPPPELL
jgi:hypothetical protein